MNNKTQHITLTLKEVERLYHFTKLHGKNQPYEKVNIFVTSTHIANLVEVSNQDGTEGKDISDYESW